MFSMYKGTLCAIISILRSTPWTADVLGEPWYGEEDSMVSPSST